ncbi:MAG: hypothetical protein FWC36_03100 [Spirochaetes bacterium]|nr:hypothetical protein [Spirochaetota bacterium]
MAEATINLTLDNDLLKQLDYLAKEQSQTRTALINNSIKMYIFQKQRLQELYAYGESIASKSNFTEEDIIEEVKNYRKSK